MDELKMLLDKIEECHHRVKCHDNDIISTRKIVEQYIDNDYDNLLKLKAELRVYEDSVDVDINLISIFTSSAALMLTAINNAPIEEYAMIASLILLALLIFVLGSHYSSREHGHRKKWRHYMNVVLEDIEKEYHGQIHKE